MPVLTKRKPVPAKVAPVALQFSRAAYLKMIRGALPIPPETEADNERLIQLMLEMEDRAGGGGAEC